MIQSLLVPLDHSAFAEEALVPAAALARTLGARLDIVLVHQQPKLANLRRSSWNNEQRLEAGRYLDHIATRLVTHGVEHCTYAVLEGDIGRIIERPVRSARSYRDDLTAERDSVGAYWSVDYALVHESDFPYVLAIRGGTV